MEDTIEDEESNDEDDMGVDGMIKVGFYFCYK